MLEMFEDMARRPVPVAEVVTGSSPVVAFGDPRNASVATLGINPSWHEFLADDGSLFSGSKRRLATLTSLNAKDTALLDLDQARTVSPSLGGRLQRGYPQAADGRRLRYPPISTGLASITAASRSAVGRYFRMLSRSSRMRATSPDRGNGAVLTLLIVLRAA
jgi:hypothetical protein